MPTAAAKSYEEEQAELQKHHSGDDEGLHIDSPAEPEVDSRFYTDVEAMLFRGFLHVSAEINDVTFVLKSLNQHEFSLIRMMQGAKDNAKSQRLFYARFLAYGVVMIDGENVLPNRENYLHRISEVFEGLPNAGRQRLVRLMGEVNRRATDAVVLTEAFSVEKYARFRWLQYKGLDLCSPTVTGFPGTEKLGLNWAQLAWRAINHADDLREQAEREWDNAKFIGSCMAGKEIQKIYTQDTNRRRREREDRLSMRDRLLRQMVLGEDPEDQVVRDGQVIHTARTVDQLADQLERSLKGEKDWHDEIVAKYEDQKRQREMERRESYQKALDSRQNDFNGRSLLGDTSLTGLTSEEVAKRISQQRPMFSSETRPEDNPEFVDKWVLMEDQPVAIEAPLVPIRKR
jgi:hypothetical protein